MIEWRREKAPFLLYLEVLQPDHADPEKPAGADVLQVKHCCRRYKCAEVESLILCSAAVSDLCTGTILSIEAWAACAAKQLARRTELMMERGCELEFDRAWNQASQSAAADSFGVGCRRLWRPRRPRSRALRQRVWSRRRRRQQVRRQQQPQQLRKGQPRWKTAAPCQHPCGCARSARRRKRVEVSLLGACTWTGRSNIERLPAATFNITQCSCFSFTVASATQRTELTRSTKS